MSVAKIIELNAASKTSMEDAVKHGLKKCAESVKNIKGAWVNEIKVVTDDDGNVQEWRVNLRVSFIVNWEEATGRAGVRLPQGRRRRPA